MPDPTPDDIKAARAAVWEAKTLTVGSHEEHEMELIREYLWAASRALRGMMTPEDRKLVDYPLTRGYGRDDLIRSPEET
jgi:hypothetical protein